MVLRFRLFWTFLAIWISTGVFGQNLFEQENQKIIDKAIKLMHQNDHANSLEMLVEAKTLAEQKKWVKQNFMATNNIGANYFLMQEFGEALNYYLEAYEIAADNHDTASVMAVLNNISVLYFHEKNMEKAYDYFLKVYRLAEENHLDEKKGLYALNLCFVLNKINRLDEAKKFLDEALELVKHNPDVYVMARMARAENNLFQGNLKESLVESLELLPQLQEKHQTENRIFVYLVLAQIYQKKGDFDNAILYAQKSIEESPSIQSKMDSYNIMSTIYADNRAYEKSIKYKDSVIFAKDSLIKERNSTLYENGKIKFEIQNYQHELRESQRQYQASQKLLYTIGISSFIILLVTGWAFRNNHIKHKQRVQISELELAKERSENLLLEKQLKEQETLALLEQEKLKNELEKKNRKLATRALHISSKNEILEEVIKQLSQNPDVLKNENLKKSIQELKLQLKNDYQLESFYTHFEEANPEFLSRLKTQHPELIPSEIRFITYVYMNLNNKEIASLLNITPESTRKRKERLGKKFNLPEGVGLFDYLSTI